MDFDSYNGGIWGWPEPAVSNEIYSFLLWIFVI